MNLTEIDICEVQNLDFKIPHRNWQSAYDEALVLLTFASPGEVVAICGPSHTGKTSLLSELKTTFKNPSPLSQGNYYWVQITTGNTGGKASFSFKAFIMELLDLIDHPVYSSNYYRESDKPTITTRINRVTEATLVRALIEGLIQRKTRYLVVDEAQDMKYAGKSTMAASGVMDALKTLAKKAEVVLVFTGTYPMLYSINCSGHLENRKYDVHLARYRRNEEDLNEFIWILANYDTVVSIDDSIGSLQNCAETLFESSIGCIGILRKILRHALMLAFKDKSRLCLRHIERAIKSSEQLEIVIDEIEAGEKFLGITSPDYLDSQRSHKTHKSTQRKGRPFQRKPIRYAPGNRTS